MLVVIGQEENKTAVMQFLDELSLAQLALRYHGLCSLLYSFDQ